MEEVLRELSEVMHHYNFNVIQIIPHCREVFRVETHEGPKALKICSKDEGKMLFIYGAMRYLWEKGFKKMSKPVPTSDGHPYVIKDGVVYFLTDWLEGRQCNFERKEDLRAAAITLGQFHNFSYGLKSPPEARARIMSHKWLKTFSARVADFKKFADIAQQTPTQFGEKYLANYEYYLEQAERAYDILTHSAYPKLASLSIEKGFFTHRDVADRNFIINNEEAYLIDFDYSRYDIRVTDVVRLLERGLKHYKWKAEFGKLIIDSYNSENPLHEEEYPVILAFITWPQRFWRIADRYFNGKKPWEEESYVRKMNSIIQKKKYRERFLKWFKEQYCN